MMLQKSILALGVAAIAFGLAACDNATGTAAPTVQLSNNNAQDVLLATRGNARAFGGSSTVYGDAGAAVTYSGSPRNFVACDAGGDVLGRIKLDTRSIMRVVGNAIQTDTIYVATRSTGSGRKSIQFSDGTSAAFSNGARCRSTGVLERSILGLE